VTVEKERSTTSVQKVTGSIPVANKENEHEIRRESKVHENNLSFLDRSRYISFK
jgi:hypothetical protein